MSVKGNSGVLSLIGGSNVTSDIMVELVKKGKLFTVQTVIEDIDVDSTINILFDFTNTDKNYLVLYELSIGVTDGCAVATFYEKGDYSGGDEIPSFCRNEVKGTIAESKMYIDPTGTGLGTELPIKYQIGTKTHPVHGGAGIKEVLTPTEVNQDVSRVLQIVHKNGSGTFNLELRILFAEI